MAMEITTMDSAGGVMAEGEVVEASGGGKSDGAMAIDDFAVPQFMYDRDDFFVQCRQGAVPARDMLEARRACHQACSGRHNSFMAVCTM